MKPLLIVDIDSTLCDFIPAFLEAAKTITGVKLPAEPVSWCEWGNFISLEETIECFDLCNEDEFAKTHMRPFDGASESLERLTEHFELAYFTDRRPETFDVTYHWLHSYDFPQIDNLYCCGDKRAEIHKIVSEREVVGIIDDRPRTLIWALYDLGLPKVTGLKHSYNVNLMDIPGIHLARDWDDLEKFLLS